MSKLFLLSIFMIAMLNLIESTPINYDEYSIDNSNPKSSSSEYQTSGQEIIPDDAIIKIIKREIDQTSRQFALSDIISNVETSLFNSALDVSNIFKDITTSTTESLPIDTVTEVTTADAMTTAKSTLLTKRNIELDNATASLETTTDLPKEILQHIKAQEIELNGDTPAHVAVDRVTVYVANSGHLPMVPSFDLNRNGNQHDTIKEIIDDAKKNSTDLLPESTISSSTASIVTEPSTKLTASSVRTTAASKTTSKDLKEAEEELKEKVAEIEAEPIILSARV